MFSAMLMRTIL